MSVHIKTFIILLFSFSLLLSVPPKVQESTEGASSNQYINGSEIENLINTIPSERIENSDVQESLKAIRYIQSTQLLLQQVVLQLELISPEQLQQQLPSDIQQLHGLISLSPEQLQQQLKQISQQQVLPSQIGQIQLQRVELLLSLPFKDRQELLQKAVDVISADLQFVQQLISTPRTGQQQMLEQRVFDYQQRINAIDAIKDGQIIRLQQLVSAPTSLDSPAEQQEEGQAYPDTDRRGEEIEDENEQLEQESLSNQQDNNMTIVVSPGAATGQVQQYYQPNNAQVLSGSKVTWYNEDSVTHTATADDGSFETGSISPGSSSSITLQGGDTISYHCNIHPFMKASISLLDMTNGING
jgi:plastocyanin